MEIGVALLAVGHGLAFGHPVETHDRGFRCIVLSDCCASYFLEFHEMGLKMIKAQGGIFGWVGRSEAVVAALCAAR